MSACSRQIEYMVVSLDDENKNARLSLRQSEILLELANETTAAKTEATPMGCVLALPMTLQVTG